MKAPYGLEVGKPYPIFHVDARPGLLRRLVVRLLLGWRWRRL